MQRNYRVGNDDLPAFVALNPDGSNIGSGSSGGGAVTVADGGDATQGAKADTAATGATITTGAFSVVALLKGIYNGMVGATPTGTNSIGTVGLNTGSNVIGKVQVADGGDLAQGTTTDTPVSASQTAAGASVVSLLKGLYNTMVSPLKATASVAFVDTIASGQAASASFTGSSRDTGYAMGGPCPFGTFKVAFVPNQAGTLFFQASADNSAWNTVGGGIAVSAGTPVAQSCPVFGRYMRMTLSNGATATTAAVTVLQQLSAV